jgi:cytochrome c oxidase subunit I+III
MTAPAALRRYDLLRREAGPVEGNHAALLRTWTEPSGFIGWLSTVSHTKIGLRFIITALVFFLLGGVEALLMRLQLARPEARFIGPDRYHQLFTTHGSTMMFLFAVPVMEGMGIYLVPLMLGTRNLAFPRLGAFAYWTYLIGGIFLYVALFTNTGPDAGWFAYTPLSGPAYAPGKRMDVWAQLITFTELSALAGAVNLIATILKLRAPGMSIDRMPLFVWAILVTSFMVVFAMPAVMVSSTCLALDRLVGTHFFNPVEGGDPLLWQHWFWFFGHPEVYIIFVPALGMVSSVIVGFSRHGVVGYTAVVLSLVATGVIGFGLWVHHMFATGLPQLGENFFTAAGMMISIPTGIQIFCWIATLWSGRPIFKTPLWFILSFFVTFLIGGLTGVMLASVPVNLVVHDTYFVVAHLHYVLIGGAVFPLFAAFHYWFPKATGRLLDERLGLVECALLFVGFHLTFFPMHLLGFHGMPRRLYTYGPDLGWSAGSLTATIGAGLLGLGVAAFLVNVVSSLRRGRRAGNDPWRGDGLEWSTTSPPPPYNFLLLPTVRGLYPLWIGGAQTTLVTGLSAESRTVLATHAVDAEPDHRIVLPGPALSPFFVALGTGVTFIGLIFTPWAAPVGILLTTIPLIGWFWPRPPHHELLEEQP